MPITNIMQGLVIASYGSLCLVETDTQQTHTCQLLKKAGNPVTGDQVIIQKQDYHEFVITEILPRKTTLSRLNQANGKVKQIAANIDQVIIVSAIKPALKTGLIDRYLVAAEFSGFTPVIVVNKTDLANVGDINNIKTKLDNYKKIGYEILYTSAKNNTGIDNPDINILLNKMSGRTSIVVGHSGVGKSSLVNALLPEQPAKIGDISSATNKGQHTTTTAYLYHLPNSGMLIDSPGIREFALWDITSTELEKGFIEFNAFTSHCKFRDCQHVAEPRCAVKKAVLDGGIDSVRYESYLSILESLSS